MPFKDAVVENVTIFNKKSEKVDSFNIKEQNNSFIKDVKNIIKKDVSNNYKKNIEIKGNEVTDLIDSLNFSKLDQFAYVNQAIALKGDKTLSVRDEYKNGYYKLLDGRDINRYSIKWSGKYLDYDLNRIHSCKRKDIFETEEKLFFRRVSSSLVFTYDNNKYYALNTLIVVNSKTTIPIKYLLGILNSKLLNHYYDKKYKSTKSVFSEIQARTVKLLPIAPFEQESSNKIINEVDNIIKSINQKNKILESIFDFIKIKYNTEVSEIFKANYNIPQYLKRIKDYLI